MGGFHVDVGSLISAIAAIAAAVFAGVNLWISGRRVHSQWARQALVESLVEFMNASLMSLVHALGAPAE